MRKQRGNIYVVLALVIAASIALYFVFEFVDAHWETSAGVLKGTTDTTALYAKRDNDALRAAIEAKRKAEARVAELEREAADRVTTADADYQRGLKDGQAKVDAAVERVHAGYRLRDPGGSSCPAAGLGGQVAAAGDPGRRDGQAGADVPAAAGCTLSAGASEFLIRLAGEADDVTRQLNVCQATLKTMYDFALKLSSTLSGVGLEPARTD